MRIRTIATSSALALLFTGALVAQTDDEGATSQVSASTMEETGMPAEDGAETAALANSDELVPTPEAGPVQTLPEQQLTAGQEQATGAEAASAEESDADAQVVAAVPDLSEQQETATELPRTASPLALLALLGVGGTGSALGFRVARRRR